MEPERSWRCLAATNVITNLPNILICPLPISSEEHYNGVEANATKDAILENSDFLNGIVMHKAIDVVVAKLEEKGIGKRQVNYKMRDAGWSRQRYWGEPFPIVYHDEIPYAMKESELPLELPKSNNFKSAGTGEGPLANLKDWVFFEAWQKTRYQHHADTRRGCMVFSSLYRSSQRKRIRGSKSA